MRTKKTPEEVRMAALKVLEMEMADLMGRERSPAWLCRAREAVTGAMYNLSIYQPSYPELGRLTGKRHHTTSLDQVRRYNRDWPPILRIQWEDAVERQLNA